MQKEHLHLLINEEIYVIDKSSDSKSEADPAPVKGDDAIPVAFIHDTTDQEELALLDKIISACNLSPQDFKIFRKGSEKAFQKAVVFTESAKDYYNIESDDDGQIINSQPLRVLKASKEEKAKLWEVLQSLSH